MNKYLARPYHLLRREGHFRKYFDDCKSNQVLPKLHVGCGNRPIPGWCNVDVAHLNDVVQYVNALKRLPFDDEAFQYIFSEHFVEHLPFADAIKFFREAHRVLKRGGVLRTATPDFDFLCELKSSNSESNRRYIEYVSKNFAPSQPKSYVTCANMTFYGWGHRFIWNAPFMEEVLKDMGFGNFAVLKPSQSAVADLRNLEQHGKSVPSEINEMETFVLEATKQ